MKFLLSPLITTLLVWSVLGEYSKEERREQEENGVNKWWNGLVNLVSQPFTKIERSSVIINLGRDTQKIKGGRNETKSSGKKYYHFQGISYAKPPVGDLRFEPPQPYTWEGTYDASYQRNICIQNSFPSSFAAKGSEDCLYLNVYTPSISPSSHLPVLVWIHGGGFLFGNGNYESNPTDNFIDQNIVVVTLNYRLGVFGFLSTGDEVVPGNMGLKDQVMALRWVQDNIEYFGGNLKNVTIMGQSAGGASVAYLVQSPATNGLFQKAIAHSGNALCRWSLARRSAANTILLAKKNAIISNNTREIVNRLKRIEDTEILFTSTLLMSFNLLLRNPLDELFVYAPVVEPPNPTEVFSAKSYEQLSSCTLTLVPLIIGYTSEEIQGVDTTLDLFRFYLARYDLNPGDLVPQDMNVNTTIEKNNVGQEIKQTYFGDTGLVFTSNGSSKYLSDDFFVRPTVEYVKLYSTCEKNVFLYRFSYSPSGTKGVGHAEDMPYFFYNETLNEEQKKLSSKVVKLWTNFIKTGDPTPDNNEFSITWPPSSIENDYTYVDIGKELINHNQSTNPDKYYLDKWTYWYDTYGNRPFDTY